MNVEIPKIDTSWTLFLDRDGVINKKLEGDYVKIIDEFEFLPYALEAIKLFSSRFHKVVIVTNQQGINKRLMTEDDLHKVHQHLLQEVQNFGGRIDAIYHAPQLGRRKFHYEKTEYWHGSTSQRGISIYRLQKKHNGR